MPAPLVTVCILTRRRHDLLRRCLASLAAQVDPPPHEVVVLANGDPESVAVAESAMPGVRTDVIARARPGEARNRFLDLATGELLLYLDDDVTCDPSLLRRLADLAAERPDVTVFGGPNETPRGSTRFQVVQGAVLASIGASGPARRRYGRHPTAVVRDTSLTLCNLAVRRSAALPFTRGLVCAEENALMHALRERGALMLYDAGLVVYHERRATLRAFARQMWTYGRGRGQLLRIEPSSARAVFLAAPAVVASWLALPALALAVGPAALLPLAAYGGAVAVNAVHIATTLRRAAAAPQAFALTLVLHACYGTGVVAGLARGIRTRAPEQSPRVGART